MVGPGPVPVGPADVPNGINFDDDLEIDLHPVPAAPPVPSFDKATVGIRKNPLQWLTSELENKFNIDITTEAGLKMAKDRDLRFTSDALENPQWVAHEYEDAIGEKYYALDIKWGYTIKDAAGNEVTDSITLRFAGYDQILPQAAPKDAEAAMTKLLTKAVAFSSFMTSHIDFDPNTKPNYVSLSSNVKDTMCSNYFTLRIITDEDNLPIAIEAQTHLSFLQNYIAKDPALLPVQPFKISLLAMTSDGKPRSDIIGVPETRNSQQAGKSLLKFLEEKAHDVYVHSLIDQAQAAKKNIHAHALLSLPIEDLQAKMALPADNPDYLKPSELAKALMGEMDSLLKTFRNYKKVFGVKEENEGMAHTIASIRQGKSSMFSDEFQEFSKTLNEREHEYLRLERECKKANNVLRKAQQDTPPDQVKLQLLTQAQEQATKEFSQFKREAAEEGEVYKASFAQLTATYNRLLDCSAKFKEVKEHPDIAQAHPSDPLVKQIKDMENLLWHKRKFLSVTGADELEKNGEFLKKLQNDFETSWLSKAYEGWVESKEAAGVAIADAWSNTKNAVKSIFKK